MNQQPYQNPLGETATVDISSLSGPKDARAFRGLNEEWISKLFSLEDADRVILGDPQVEIVDKGGQVLLARSQGVVVGCVALVAAGNGVFELSKMTVSPSKRGKGLGRTIVLAAIDEARKMGASTLFLGSSTKLANAVRLYESVGFRHVPPEELGSLPYRRADVFMKYELCAVGSCVRQRDPIEVIVDRRPPGSGARTGDRLTCPTVWVPVLVAN